VLWVEDPDPSTAAAALADGMRCVLAGEVSATLLHAATVAAATGLLAVSANLKDVMRGGLFARARKSDQESFDLEDTFPEHLTTREIEVLEMIVEGFSNKEIAAQLDISAYTVKFHLSSILGKLGASSRTEAAAIGLRRGLIAI
jgi:DNA-binding NarL/FixJ family response regulator